MNAPELSRSRKVDLERLIKVNPKVKSPLATELERAAVPVVVCGARLDECCFVEWPLTQLNQRLADQVFECSSIH